MSLVKERKYGTNITRYYKLEQVFSNLSAVEWISSVRSISGVDVEYVYYSDLMNRSDEGSSNVQLDAQVAVDTMKQELKMRDVDIITLNGTFNGKPLVIGVDLRNNLVYLTIRKRMPADVELIEKMLKLRV